MKKLEEFITEKSKSLATFYTTINKDNVSLLQKVVDYVNANGEAAFEFTTELTGNAFAGNFSSVRIFDENAKPGEKFKEL